MQNITTIILAAGKGSRMRSNTPKPLHSIAHKPILQHTLDELQNLQKKSKISQKIILVHANNQQQIQNIGKQYNTTNITQQQQKGTAHAVLQCLPAIRKNNKILILFGDSPFTPTALMKKLLQKINDKTIVAIAGFEKTTPNAYGRVILDNDGTPLKIIEAKDATAAELKNPLCNGGIMALHPKALPLLKKINDKNKQKEYLLPHIVEIARKHNFQTTLVKGKEEDFIGVNSPEDLAAAEAIFQNRQRQDMLKKGVRMSDPETVYFSADTKIAADAEIEPFVVFGPGVAIEKHAKIYAFSHITGAHIGAAAHIGPFARIRPTSHIAEQSKIGNFVEVKNSHIERGAKASHLNYIGDSTIGENANIGAGAITANYDGKRKHRTTIGAGASVGINASLIAPLKIGKNARIGAGSTITDDVAEGVLEVARVRQKTPATRAKKRKG